MTAEAPRTAASSAVVHGVTTPQTGMLRRVISLLPRMPFTLAVVATLLVVGVATGCLWSALSGRPLLDVVAYGLPALQDGRWWTPVTGAFFAISPLQYIPVVGGFLLLTGFAELRLGTRRAATVAVALQLGAVLTAAGFFALTSGHGWPWADDLAGRLDVGFSAGCGRRRRRGVGHAGTAVARTAARGTARLRAGLADVRRRDLGRRAHHRHLRRTGLRTTARGSSTDAEDALTEPARAADHGCRRLRRRGGGLAAGRRGAGRPVGDRRQGRRHVPDDRLARRAGLAADRERRAQGTPPGVAMGRRLHRPS